MNALIYLYKTVSILISIILASLLVNKFSNFRAEIFLIFVIILAFFIYKIIDLTTKNIQTKLIEFEGLENKVDYYIFGENIKDPSGKLVEKVVEKEIDNVNYTFYIVSDDKKPNNKIILISDGNPNNNKKTVYTKSPSTDDDFNNILKNAKKAGKTLSIKSKKGKTKKESKDSNMKDNYILFGKDIADEDGRIVEKIVEKQIGGKNLKFYMISDENNTSRILISDGNTKNNKKAWIEGAPNDIKDLQEVIDNSEPANEDLKLKGGKNEETKKEVINNTVNTKKGGNEFFLYGDEISNADGIKVERIVEKKINGKNYKFYMITNNDKKSTNILISDGNTKNNKKAFIEGLPNEQEDFNLIIENSEPAEESLLLKSPAKVDLKDKKTKDKSKKDKKDKKDKNKKDKKDENKLSDIEKALSTIPMTKNDDIKIQSEEKYAKSKSKINIPSEESIQPSDFLMYGELIGKDIPVEAIKTLPNGVDLFLIQDGDTVRVANSTGYGCYYVGKVSEFNTDKLKTCRDVAPGKYLVKRKKKEEELNPNNYLIYGEWVSKETPVERIVTLPNGRKVFMIQDQALVKMTMENGEGCYYKGKLSDFSLPVLSTCTPVAPGKYLVKKVGSAPPKDQVDPKQYIMMGEWIAGKIPVSRIEILPINRKLYIAQDGSLVKMITDDGMGFYYEGLVSDFNINEIDLYEKTPRGKYVLKKISEKESKDIMGVPGGITQNKKMLNVGKLNKDLGNIPEKKDSFFENNNQKMDDIYSYGSKEIQELKKLSSNNNQFDLPLKNVKNLSKDKMNEFKIKKKGDNFGLNLKSELEKWNKEIDSGEFDKRVKMDAQRKMDEGEFELQKINDNRSGKKINKNRNIPEPILERNQKLKDLVPADILRETPQTYQTSSDLLKNTAKNNGITRAASGEPIKLQPNIIRPTEESKIITPNVNKYHMDDGRKKVSVIKPTEESIMDNGHKKINNRFTTPKMMFDIEVNYNTTNSKTINDFDMDY